MFWSKIWFFIIAVAAATALTIAIVMPRPAGREQIRQEAPQLVKACSFTNILLQANARARIDLTDSFSRAPGLAKVIEKASAEEKISAQSNSDAKQAVRKVLAQLEKMKDRKQIAADLVPDFVYVVDEAGRIVGREGKQADPALYGKHSLAGYFAVDDALHGYLSDDLWVVDKKQAPELYRVAVAPIIRRGEVDKLVGAIILGHELDVSYAKDLADKLNFNVNFYAGGHLVANSQALQIDGDVKAAFEATKWEGNRSDDCVKSTAFTAKDGSETYNLLLARLPGEAGMSQGAYFAVYLKRNAALGFSATLDKVKKADLSFKNFPWLTLAFLFLLAMGGGLFLMVWETDLPLRRLADDAVRMAKGDAERLSEDKHKGKFGSVARSVNIQLDKLARESKAAKKDLDQLLGPAPDGGLALKGGFESSSGIGLNDDGPMFAPPPPPPSFGGPSTPPPVRATAAPPPAPPPLPSAAATASPFDLDLPPPPPPAAKGPAPAAPTDKQVPPPPVSLPMAAAPPPRTARAPTPPPLPPSLPTAFDDDILAPDPDPEDSEVDMPTSMRRVPSDFDAPTRVAEPDESLLEASGAESSDEGEFRRVFDDFVALKTACGESTATLTYDKFARKLRKNREGLMAKHNCRSVRFQVYEKNGKAALKATPVKD